MDVATILDAVSVVGFPVVVCIIIMVFVKYLVDKNAEQIAHMTDQHRAEMAEITKAVENNTLALTKLMERIGKED